MSDLHECITCYERVNVLPGFNCQRCSSSAGSSVEQGQQIKTLKRLDITSYGGVPEEVIKNNARLVAEALVNAFAWAAADETGYWGKVYERLCKIHQEGYPK